MVNIPVFTGFHTCWVVGLGISEPSNIGIIYFISHWKTKDPLDSGCPVGCFTRYQDRYLQYHLRHSGSPPKQRNWKGEGFEGNPVKRWMAKRWRRWVERNWLMKLNFMFFFGVKLTLKQNFVSFFLVKLTLKLNFVSVCFGWNYCSLCQTGWSFSLLANSSCSCSEGRTKYPTWTTILISEISAWPPTSPPAPELKTLKSWVNNSLQH